MIHAINDLFTNPALRKVLYRTRYLLGFVLLLPLAYFMKPEFLLPGFIVSMFGQLIQVWSFSSLVKNRELTMRGPYLLVRNPMYLGRFFLLAGFVMLPGSLVALAVFAVLYYFYMFNRVRREEARLQRLFIERFRRYCDQVNRFFPSLRAFGSREVWFFDRARFLENNAHWNFLTTLAAYGLVWAIHHFELLR